MYRLLSDQAVCFILIPHEIYTMKYLNLCCLNKYAIWKLPKYFYTWFFVLWLLQESCRFRDNATQVIMSLGKCIMGFSDAEQFQTAWAEFVRSHCPYLDDKQMSKKRHFQVSHLKRAELKLCDIMKRSFLYGSVSVAFLDMSFYSWLWKDEIGMTETENKLKQGSTLPIPMS